MCIFLSVRRCIEATWLNDCDQFLYPNYGWKTDKEFQNDCLAYTLFSNSNNIQSAQGTNHWIPFTEEEVGAQDCFESHFMHDYITGKHEIKAAPRQLDAFYQTPVVREKHPQLVFSAEARAVMDAARELWRYYHKQKNVNPNASYYEIRLYFQGTKTSKNGKIQMKGESDDETYTRHLSTLRKQMKALAQKIEPKVYEHGFLKK